MRIGVPKEIKNHEYRVGLVPSSVKELIHANHDVFVETNAGLGIGFTDECYEAAGAKILKTAKELVFAKQYQQDEIEPANSRPSIQAKYRRNIAIQ